MYNVDAHNTRTARDTSTLYIRALCIRVIYMHLARVRRTLSRDVTRARTYANTIHICASCGMCACILHVLHTTTQPDDHHTHHNHHCCHHHHKHHIISSYDDHQHFIIAGLHTIINARVHIVNLVYKTLFNLYIYTRLIPQSSPNQPVMLKIPQSWLHAPLAPDTSSSFAEAMASQEPAMPPAAAAVPEPQAKVKAVPTTKALAKAASAKVMKVMKAKVMKAKRVMKVKAASSTPKAMKVMKARVMKVMKVMKAKVMKAKRIAMKAAATPKAMKVKVMKRKAMKSAADSGPNKKAKLEAQMQKWEAAVNLVYTLTHTKQTILHRQIMYTQTILHKPDQTYHRLLGWIRYYTDHEQGFLNNV